MYDDDGLGILPTDEPQEVPEETLVDEPEEEEVEEQEVPTYTKEFTDDGVDIRYTQDVKIFCLKTQVGQERKVAEFLMAKAKKFNVPILSILSPSDLRGYIFIESTDLNQLERGIRGVTYARSLVTREYEVYDADGHIVRSKIGRVVKERKPALIDFSEVAHYLTPVSAVAKIEVGNLVELISGPFKGENAKVTRVDDTKEEITVELVDSPVPIPITVRGENVRVIDANQ